MSDGQEPRDPATSPQLPEQIGGYRIQSLISSGGIVMKTKVKQISQMGRAAMGVRVMDLKKGETVASVAISSAKDLLIAGVDEEGAEAAPDEKPKKKASTKKKPSAKKKK